MSKLVEIDLRVNENVFTSVAQKLGWKCSGKTLTKEGMYRELQLKNGRVIYDNMDVEPVKDLVGHYLAEITGGTIHKRGKEIFVEVFR